MTWSKNNWSGALLGSTVESQARSILILVLIALNSWSGWSILEVVTQQSDYSKVITFHAC